MTSLRLALRQVRYTNTSFWRNPAAAFFTFVFPLMFLVIFASIFGNSQVPLASGVTVSTATFYVPAIAVFSVITACYTNIALGLSFTRDSGILKRIRGTPLPGWAYLVGRILHAVLIAVLLVAICAGFGVIFYHVTLPTTTLPAFLLTLLVGAASFCALGAAATALVPNADAAPAVVNASILPLLFISNVFVPLTNPPAWLDTLSNIFPVRHFADALIGSFFATSGSGFSWPDLAVIAAWGVAGLLLAVRFFSWEPRA
ncbi:MAG: ABC transporter permease [Candidatus Limnocylindrales bacterium]